MPCHDAISAILGVSQHVGRWQAWPAYLLLLALPISDDVVPDKPQQRDAVADRLDQSDLLVQEHGAEDYQARGPGHRDDLEHHR